MMKKHKLAAGFTLVEVLVALGIFAILSTGYLIVTGDSVRGLGKLQDKMFALWVAEDTVTRLRTYDADDNDKFSQQTLDFLDRSWVVSFDKVSTEVKSMSRVTLSVALAEQSEFSLVSLETYFYDGPFVPQGSP